MAKKKKDKKQPVRKPLIYNSGIFDDVETVTTMEEVANKWSTCTACLLHKKRSGSALLGNRWIPCSSGMMHCYNYREASVLVVGQFPGGPEDKSGVLFSGRQGIVAREFIFGTTNQIAHRATGIRPEDVFWTNALACYPGKVEGVNRDMLNACRPRLRSTILSVKPRLIIALGLIAAQTLLAPGSRVGRLSDVRILRHSYDGIPTAVVGHPAVLNRMRRASESDRNIRNKQRELQADMDFVANLYTNER